MASLSSNLRVLGLENAMKSPLNSYKVYSQGPCFPPAQGGETRITCHEIFLFYNQAVKQSIKVSLSWDYGPHGLPHPPPTVKTDVSVGAGRRRSGPAELPDLYGFELHSEEHWLSWLTTAFTYWQAAYAQLSLGSWYFVHGHRPNLNMGCKRY